MPLTITPDLRTKLVQLIETAYEAAELLNGCPDDEDADACAQLLSDSASEIEVAILGADDRLDSSSTPPEESQPIRDLRWAVEKLTRPDKAAHGRLRGTEAIRFRAARALAALTESPSPAEPQAEPDDGRLAYPAFVLSLAPRLVHRRYTGAGYIPRPIESLTAFNARCAEQDADDPPDSWVFAREFATHREQAT